MTETKKGPETKEYKLSRGRQKTLRFTGRRVGNQHLCDCDWNIYETNGGTWIAQYRHNKFAKSSYTRVWTAASAGELAALVAEELPDNGQFHLFRNAMRDAGEPYEEEIK